MAQIIIAVIAGIVVGVILMWIAGKMGLDRNKEKSQGIIDEANSNDPSGKSRW